MPSIGLVVTGSGCQDGDCFAASSPPWSMLKYTVCSGQKCAARIRDSDRRCGVSPAAVNTASVGAKTVPPPMRGQPELTMSNGREEESDSGGWQSADQDLQIWALRQCSINDVYHTVDCANVLFDGVRDQHIERCCFWQRPEELIDASIMYLFHSDCLPSSRRRVCFIQTQCA